MVSTRHQPGPSKSSSSPQSSSSRSKPIHQYAHKVPPLFVIWLLVSLPLVVWDTGYISLRPHSMPGGKYHEPIWKLYAIYGTVDYIYGWPAFNNHVGFTAAQASLNVVETVMYIYYAIVIYKNSTRSLLSARDMKGFFLGEEDKSVRGPGVAKGVLYLFSAAVMTLSKTVLYWLNEYFSDFANIGHNNAYDLILLWIIPNGLWLIFPTYIIYVLGIEMLEAMDGLKTEKEE